MEAATESLFWIMLVAVVAPPLALLVPRRLVPEVVLLLVLGVLIGPYGLELASEGEAINLLHELGLGMLFLFAGYEIEPAELTGRDGRRALWTWLACLALAWSVSAGLDLAGLISHETALAIALTSTALGTLLPILKDNRLMRDPVGVSVLRHGAYGELGPIIAIAVLLSSRGVLGSLVVLALFAVITVLLAVPSIRLRDAESRLLGMIRHGAETTGQTPVRLTIFLLVTFAAVAVVLDLDIVLAAFAAGFILRLALPDGNQVLDSKIEGIAFGFFVPIFFVTTGMTIDPSVIADHLLEFGLVFVMILLARGGPVLFASRSIGPPEARFGSRESLAIALFASTGLPIIVAVTSVSVRAGQMSVENASLLVGAGAATVLICPMLALLVLGDRRAPQPRNAGSTSRP